jgi:hypothetical protein
MAMRPKVASSGSSNSSHSRVPAAMARSGSSGMLGTPSMLVMSEYRKSRMKKCFDKPHPAKLFQSLNGLRLLHGWYLRAICFRKPESTFRIALHTSF